MTKPTKYDAQRAQYLASSILKHKKLYYAGQPEISDAAYDLLEDELKELAPTHPVLEIVGSGEFTSINAKVTHETPMLSLNKTYSQDELLRWMNGQECVGTLKVDGTSLSLVYENGSLKLGKTRGSGREGEDVTQKIQWVSEIVPVIHATGVVEVRGELHCRESQFVQLVQEMSQLGLEKPTSPRNIVAGVLGRKIHSELSRYFSFFAFDVLGVASIPSEISKFEWLKSQGFSTPLVKLLKTKDEVLDFLDQTRSVIEEDDVGCDGAVFAYNDLSTHKDLGTTAHHPRFKMSFKWQGQTAQSTVKRIDWATSRLGIVTPVAVIDPVDLSGASITNITLHNAAHVKAYNLKPGDQIELVRSGEVIPKFLSVVKASTGSATLPEVCPSCQSLVSFDGIRLKCLNQGQCPAQRAGAILNWIQTVGVEDLSGKRLQNLIDARLVHSVPDLYRVKESDLLKLPSTKEKMAAKLFANIQASRSLPLSVFLCGLGIEGTGLTTWEKICEYLPTLSQVRSASFDELVAIDGLAEKSVTQIMAGLAANASLIDELIEVGVKPLDQIRKTQTSTKFAGKIFVITGTLSKPRDEIEKAIKDAGGKVSSSVSKNTTALITNDTDSGSSKMKKAESLAIPVWSENDLQKNLLGDGA
jgi:DNA ligase (NAD+)